MVRPAKYHVSFNLFSFIFDDPEVRPTAAHEEFYVGIRRLERGAPARAAGRGAQRIGSGF